MIGRQFRVASVLFVAAVLTAARATAQIAPPPEQDDQSHPRIHIGGLTANPTFALTNIGTDSNVFNSVDNPQSDFTATLSPGLDVWAHLGKARVSARGQTDLVYFRRFSSERSVDGGFGSRVEVPLNRLIPWAEGGSYTGRHRVGYEIDVRSRRTTNDVGVGVNYRAGAKTLIGVGVHDDSTAWDANATFLGSSLRFYLDRQSESATASLRQELTALTTVVVETTATRDRFRYASERNTDGVRGVVGLDLGTHALISGRVRVGVHDFTPKSGAFQSFHGVVASADVGYVLHGSTQFAAQIDRDTDYSFEPLYPYYLQTGGSLTITQRLSNLWDVQARGGRSDLAYRPLAGAVGVIVDRTDVTRQVGLGAGYHLNRGVRIGFNVDKYWRSSPVLLRAYSGFKAGGSVTYAR